mgnify:CR=1 FL=1
MKILQINSVCGIRSTGRICTDIADILMENGAECRIGYGRNAVPERYCRLAVPIGERKDLLIHGVGSRLLDNSGFYSKAATRKFLMWVDEYRPDLIHLHNIHGYYLNVELLFDYLKEKNLPVVWTLHDCWAFTGHCSHFSAIGCEKWKEGCCGCPLRGEYPRSVWRDNSGGNYRRKKELFCGVKQLQIVTPSDWLSGCAEQSFLGNYPIKTIQNGVDLSVFHPVKSDFLESYHLQGKKIVLGVASAWTKHKGLALFYRLAQLLDNSYQVVLVGLSAQQIKKLPQNILGIARTNCVQELVQIYSAAYVHVSMSREETMGLTLIEANACGTPVIVFNSTALPEIVTPETGMVLQECTPEAVARALQNNDFSRERFMSSCVTHARQFEKTKMYSKYLELYRSMIL